MGALNYRAWFGPLLLFRLIRPFQDWTSGTAFRVQFISYKFIFRSIIMEENWLLHDLVANILDNVFGRAWMR